MIQDYIAIDLETTGLNPKEDAIIEIGAVKVRDGIETDFFSTLVYPGRKIPERITQLTGITNQDVNGKPMFEEIEEQLLTFLGHDILLGHSLLFDYAFLKRAFLNHSSIQTDGKKTFERMGIDTLKMAREKLPELASRSLGSLCEYYMIPLAAHRALNDASATSLLYQKLSAIYYQQNDIVPYPLIYKVKREGHVTRVQKERLYKLLEKHKINTEYDIDSLTRNEADRYLDRILAEFGR